MEIDPHRDTLGYVQAKALLNTLAFALEQAKPKDLAADFAMWRRRETISDSLSDVEAEALADMIGATLPEAKA